MLDGRGLLWALVLCGPAGYVALEAGWIVTEVGRQPWVINGVLRTSDAVTTAGGVPAVFFGFCVLYAILAAAVVGFLVRLGRVPGGSKVKPGAPQEVPLPTPAVEGVR